MIYTRRIRRILVAALVAFAITMAAATPIITDIAGFDGTVSADGCEGSTC
ncbi:MAG: hypothetical protein KDJ52_20825 [Anaerolineae bacterium]|nr:hypothetical protein [Anaerolineae bacterium]